MCNAKNCLLAWQTLPMIRVIAENRLPAWQTLQMTAVSAKTAYQPAKLYKWPE
jgi:hypothetical protein